MNEHIRMTFRLGAAALSACVGIYYCAVRQRARARQRNEEAIRVALSNPAQDPLTTGPVAQESR